MDGWIVDDWLESKDFTVDSRLLFMFTFLTFINLNYHQTPEAPLKSHLAGWFSRQTIAEICQNCTKLAYNINILMIVLDFLFFH